MHAYTIAGVLASATLITAQNTTTSTPKSSTYHPHGAFAFIRTGERTPLSRPGVPVLSAVGANTMFTLGQNFRTRYIAGTSPSGLGIEPMNGLAPKILNNEQISIQTSDSQYLVAAAQAFMQGLYPPRATANGSGPVTGLLADGTTVDYPLDGYQYASIQTRGPDDAGSILVSGSSNCPTAKRDAMKYFKTAEFEQIQEESKGLFGRLNLDWFEGTLGEHDLDYNSALEIADYLRYQHQHNTSIYTALTSDSNYASLYPQILRLADTEAWYLYGNTSTTSPHSSTYRAMAGQTVANSILSQFRLLIASRLHGASPSTDLSNALTFFFGEQEPMVSLLSLISADIHNTYFRSIPTYGSAMVFELYSTGENADFPTNNEDLWVRFYYHNATRGFQEDKIVTYPILGNGPSGTDIPWREFESVVQSFSVERVEWCGSCDSPAVFCEGVNGGAQDPLRNEPATSWRRGKVSPAVAGVIGAIVALVVAGLLFALVALLLGVRFHRVERKGGRKSDLGGFKGSAKLASDPDLSLAANGVPPAGIVTSGFGAAKKGHERVGSWELRQKEFGKGGGYGERESMDGIDAIAAGGRPVVPDERV
ncbi:phosphoglycerate mutase-like protein [Plenodomus tracheiphilus IPT5]|uniref:Phosphoglycerate mutase-like protein n=1 Tax=Plenodomus tracheiphilus IPT5 TaxID=1408161 RepID=A0A6A7BN95_9PLEO|nr:phosphoglycerate mutase-like protein [Plenodomus tracheiphilus IPT5]